MKRQPDAGAPEERDIRIPMDSIASGAWKGGGAFDRERGPPILHRHGPGVCRRPG